MSPIHTDTNMVLDQTVRYDSETNHASPTVTVGQVTNTYPISNQVLDQTVRSDSETNHASPTVTVGQVTNTYQYQTRF